MANPESVFPETGKERLLSMLCAASKNKTFKELGEISNLSSGHVNKLARGIIPSFSPKVMKGIAKIIGLTIAETYAIALDIDLKSMMTDVTTPKECANVCINKFSEAELHELAMYLFKHLSKSE